MSVNFLLHSGRIELGNKTQLKKWISAIIKNENKKEGKINYLFCTDKELHKINREFLNHDTYTDIITFDYSESNKVSGEIYISSERVKENSQKLKTEFESELRRVIIHGVLHLCGYKDKNPAQKKEMRDKEDDALTKFNLIPSSRKTNKKNK
jgi:rRNA maturation RNase YbeY